MITGLVDPMAYMIALGLAGSAFIILVFVTRLPMRQSLQHDSRGGRCPTKTPEWQLMLVSGAVGTGLAMLGITDHFIEFLERLGVIVPPIAGIYLVDYFLLGQQRFPTELRASFPTTIGQRWLPGL